MTARFPHTPHLGAVVLAAGPSRRLRRPKQLLASRGEPLVARAAHLVIAAGAERTVVVVGAHAAAVTRALSGIPVTVVRNRSWARGMGTSLAAGVAALPAGTVACLYLLVDQYAVTVAHLRALVATHVHSGGDATLTRYDDRGTRGPPAVIGSRVLPRAATLRGEPGVRAMLSAGDRVNEIRFPKANLDVDHQRDIASLLQ